MPLSTTYEDPRTGARAGYENGFFAEIPLPGGGLGYNHRQGLHAGWAAVTDESMLSLYGDPRYLHALAANKEMAAYARMPTQSLLRGDPQLDRFNFRSDSLAVDWHPGQLNLNFQHGALSAEVHNNHYIFGLQEGSAGALFSDRAAGAFYADDSLKFSGFLDPTDPRYGRTDLWVRSGPVNPR